MSVKNSGKNTNADYIQEIDNYLGELSIADYRSFVDFCLRAPSDMRVLISEIMRLRSDIDRYRDDIKRLKIELNEFKRMGSSDDEPTLPSK